MYLPASIRVDYDHIEEFRKYAVEDAELECLIIVSNQYGPNKISVYGLGDFPAEENMRIENLEKKSDLSEGVVATEQAEEKSD